MSGARRLDALVVGAGVTGLAAAFRLARAGLAVEVVEAAAEVGGAVSTRTFERPEGRWIVELGPNTVVDGRPAVGALVADAGLAEERVDASPAARRRLIWKDGGLHPLPGGPLGFVATPLFGARGKLRLLGEPFAGRPAGGRGAEADESIADFVRRRLGPAALADAVGPFVSGVWAGDPERLSMRWALPRLHQLEERHGGLLRGALATLRARRRDASPGPRPSRRLFTLRDGLATLPRRLAAEVPVATGTPARSLRRGANGDGFVVETDAGTRAAPRVVLAVPAAEAAEVLHEVAGGAARALAEVPTVPVTVAAYGFRREQVAHPLDGFGFLAPRGAGLRLLGCLFPSSIFPGRAPDGHVLLTAFLGGRLDPEAAALPDDDLDRTLLADLDRALGVTGPPLLRLVRRWPRAIPQYELGHGRFVRLAEQIERELPGLHLAGSYRDGVSLPDRLDAGTAVAAAILGDEAERRPPRRAAAPEA